MAHNGNSVSKNEQFLLDEYKGLLDLNKSREERFDKLLTMFLSLAGAPWVLFGFIVKDTHSFSLSDMPRLVAAVFVVVGGLGTIVVVMSVQTKFLITMYARATNGIRGYFAEQDGKAIASALRLPTKTNVPRYFEKASYNFWAACGMATVNAAYVMLGVYQMLRPQPRAIWPASIAGAILLLGQAAYYVWQAHGRESRDSGDEIGFKNRSKLIDLWAEFRKLFRRS